MRMFQMKHDARSTRASGSVALAIAGPAGAQQNPVVIGGTLGLTGAYAEPSTDYKFVYDRWLDEVNKKGGLLGRPVKMVIYNDESTPTVAQALYNRLLDQDKVDIVLAPYTTFVGGAVVPIVMSHKKLLFNGGFVGINIFKNNKGSIIGSYTYQEPDYTRGLFEMIAQPAGRAAAQAPRDLHLAEPVHRGGARRHRRHRRRAQLRQGRPASRSWSTSSIRRTPPTSPAWCRRPRPPMPTWCWRSACRTTRCKIARTMHQQNYKPAVFCTCGSQVTTLSAWPKLGAAAEGAFGTTVSWPTQGFPGCAELAEVFKTRGYETLPTYAIVGYAILQVIEQAVNGAKTSDQEKLKDYIYRNEFKTAAGNIRLPGRRHSGLQPDLHPVHQRQEPGGLAQAVPDRAAGAHPESP